METVHSFVWKRAADPCQYQSITALLSVWAVKLAGSVPTIAGGFLIPAREYDREIFCPKCEGGFFCSQVPDISTQAGLD